MKNLRRIFAIIGILLLLGIYASTMVFALMKHPLADRFLMASIFCTVAVPVLLYGMILVAKNLEQRGEELRREAEELQHGTEDAAGRTSNIHGESSPDDTNEEGDC